MRSVYRYTLFAFCLAGLLHAAQAQEEQRAPTVSERLDRIERLLQSQGLMDMLEQIRQLQEEVSKLRGEIEMQNHRIEQLQQRQRNLYADIDQRMQRLESGGAGATGTGQPGGIGEDGPPLTTLSPVTGGIGPAGRSSDSSLTVEMMAGEEERPSGESGTDEETTTTATEGPPPGVEPEDEGVDIQPAAVEQAAGASPVQIQADYQEAFRLLKQSRYDQAIRSFTKFLAAYPDSDYADNAQYWLAEAYYVTRAFEPALKEYNKLVSQYPNSQKLAHGLLKIGYTLHELGRTEEAKQQLQDLMQKYPGTTAARLADERLKDINTTQPAENPEPG